MPRQLETDEILAVTLDDSGCLCVRPRNQCFPYIYREAMDVHWDETRKVLRSPPPRQHLDFSKLRWFQQIVDAAKMQGYVLLITDQTEWFAVPEDLKKGIMEWQKEHLTLPRSPCL